VILGKSIPKNLRPLLPLLKGLGISDDVERELVIEELTDEQKINLVRIVEPFIEDINKFLDSFGNIPLSEEAMLLGNLAELVSELRNNADS